MGMGLFIEVGTEIVGMRIIVAVHCHSDILITILVLLTIIGRVGKITQPIYFIPTGVVSIGIEVTVVIKSTDHCCMDRFFAFLTVEEENITGLYAGIFCLQSMYSVGRNDQGLRGTQTGIQQCVLHRVHTTGQDLYATGIQTCLNKFVANTNAIIPMRSSIGDCGLIVITGAEFRGTDGK